MIQKHEESFQLVNFINAHPTYPSNWHTIQSKQVKNILYWTLQTGGTQQIEMQLQAGPVVKNNIFFPPGHAVSRHVFFPVNNVKNVDDIFYGGTYSIV